MKGQICYSGRIADDEEETTVNPTALQKALKSFAIRKHRLVVEPSVGSWNKF